MDDCCKSNDPRNMGKCSKRPAFANSKPIEDSHKQKFGGGSLFIDGNGESACCLEVKKAKKVNPSAQHWHLQAQ